MKVVDCESPIAVRDRRVILTVMMRWMCRLFVVRQVSMCCARIFTCKSTCFTTFCTVFFSQHFPTSFLFVKVSYIYCLEHQLDFFLFSIFHMYDICWWKVIIQKQGHNIFKLTGFAFISIFFIDIVFCCAPQGHSLNCQILLKYDHPSISVSINIDHFWYTVGYGIWHRA